MSTAVPLSEPARRYAVTLEELETVRVSETQMLQEVGDPYRLLAPDTAPGIGTAGDSDGDGD